MNGEIFIGQGQALNEVASRDVKVLVVGNPANTNAYIAMKSAPDLPAKNFTAMLRLDHNRALTQIAQKRVLPLADIKNMTVWGNHSPTMYADYRFATVNGESLKTKSTMLTGTRMYSFQLLVNVVLRLSKRVVCLQLLQLLTLLSTICAIGLLAQTANG